MQFGVEFIIVAILALFLIGQGIFITYRGRKKGDSLLESFLKAWPKIRPLVLDFLVDAVNIHYKNMGFEELLQYIVVLIKKEVENSKMLTEEEKKILSDEKFLEIIIRPMLKDLWNKYKEEKVLSRDMIV